MNLQGIVAVSGKPGLWRALSQNKTGYILESIDAQKTKLVANLSTAKLAALDEITIFGNQDDIKLTDVFERIKSAKNVPDAKADGKVLRDFFREVAPDHDEEKVYASDMKKVVAWFSILKDTSYFAEEEKAPEVPAADAPVIEKPAVKAKQPAKTATPKPANARADAKPKSTVKARKAE